MIVASKYRIVRKLGEGGTATVWEAFHERLKQRVALKVLLSDFVSDDELIERFEREARAAATLDSPNVAKVLDVDTLDDGVPYMVIEFLDGHDLATELDRRVRFSPSEAVALVMRACVPIAQAHAAGIIHRDLKPANLFLAKKGDEEVLKLLDFGISKVIEERGGKITNPELALGSPHYMSPEQVRGVSDLDARTDVWSLGVIMYELLTGTVPFPFDATETIAAIAADPVTPPTVVWPDIPAALEAVVMRALEKDRKKRFQTIRELAVALAPFAPDEVVPVSARFMRRVETNPPPSTTAAIRTVHPPTPARRWRWGGIVMLAVASACGVAFWQYSLRGRATHAVRPEPQPIVARSAPPPPPAPVVVVVETATTTTTSTAPSATPAPPPPPPPTRHPQRPPPSVTASSPPPPVSAAPSANPLML